MMLFFFRLCVSLFGDILVFFFLFFELAFFVLLLRFLSL